MNEQQSVSLPTREQIAEALSMLLSLAHRESSADVSVVEIKRTVYAVLALLTQPDPTADMSGLGKTRGKPPEPPRIEDLAPGTTFWARTNDGIRSLHDSLWVVDACGGVLSLHGTSLNPERIDPSTIRDVQPPAVTS